MNKAECERFANILGHMTWHFMCAAAEYAKDGYPTLAEACAKKAYCFAVVAGLFGKAALRRTE